MVGHPLPWWVMSSAGYAEKESPDTIRLANCGERCVPLQEGGWEGKGKMRVPLDDRKSLCWPLPCSNNLVLIKHRCPIKLRIQRFDLLLSGC
ncbi:hypothetical protein SAMN05444385_11353 [Tritonibacter mobilis]|nr:hypothetical protein SAMN05444385_11353 [Tritonibacter mobilis]